MERTLLTTLSAELAAAVEVAGRAVVSVDARRQQSASGVIWLSDGIVVTADHVLERDEDIGVTLAGGQRVVGRVAGRDPGSDLAVLRLTAASPPPADLAPEDSVKVGGLVLAIGRPGDGGVRASFGVISALGGSWRTARGGTLEAYVRADLRLYPGFSGGPLVDTEGRVIGLNSWYLARGEDLAIPTQTVSRIVHTLLTEGRVRRAYLGITSQPVPLPAKFRESAGLGQETGLMVIGVETSSPAEAGGLLLGDVLLSVGGAAVADVQDLQASLGPAAVGQQIAISVLRGGRRRELAVTPRERA